MLIRELGCEEVDGALERARAAGCERPAERLLRRLSLVALDDQGQVAAQVVCFRDEGGGVVCEVSEPGEAGEAVRGLMDKALLKLNGAGVRRCRFRVAEAGAEQRLWAGANWLSGVGGAASLK